MDELERDDPGIPEPQIGPSQFNPRMSGADVVHSGGGDHQIILLESIEELSQDSLDETQETIEEEMSRPSSRPSSGRSSRASSGQSSTARVQYAPTVNQTVDQSNVERPVSRQSNQSENSRTNPTPSAGAPIEHLIPFDDQLEIENPFELRENYLLPLASAGGGVPDQSVSMELVVDTMMDDLREQLKDQLKIEWDRDRKVLEDEHIKRLKELNEHHQNEQFQLYQKNLELHEKINNLGTCLKEKDKGIKRLQAALLEEGEVEIKSRAIHAWRLACYEKRAEKKIIKIVEETRQRRLIQVYFHKWTAICRAKYKTKVERVCKERATEICLKLKDELTSEINRLKQEVANRDLIISDLEQKHARYEEGLSKALMRGVCALNMEAMSVLNNPDFNAMNDENVENLLRVGSAGDRVPSASGSRFSAPQNSARDPDPSIIIPTNKIYKVTKPASNVFIDTVNSLDDINSKKKKVKVRNSSEISGRIADRNEALSRSVRIERHQEHGRSVKTDFNITTRPEVKKPWVPASVNILNCENQKSKRRGTKQTFGAVKHVD